MVDRPPARREFVSGDALSIANTALWPWARQEQWRDDKPRFFRCLDALAARPAGRCGRAIGTNRRAEVTSDRASRTAPFRRR